MCFFCLSMIDVDIRVLSRVLVSDTSDISSNNPLQRNAKVPYLQAK